MNLLKIPLCTDITHLSASTQFEKNVQFNKNRLNGLLAEYDAFQLLKQFFNEFEIFQNDETFVENRGYDFYFFEEGIKRKIQVKTSCEYYNTSSITGSSKKSLLENDYFAFCYFDQHNQKLWLWGLYTGEHINENVNILENKDNKWFMLFKDDSISDYREVEVK